MNHRERDGLFLRGGGVGVWGSGTIGRKESVGSTPGVSLETEEGQRGPWVVVRPYLDIRSPLFIVTRLISVLTNLGIEGLFV